MEYDQQERRKRRRQRRQEQQQDSTSNIKTQKSTDDNNQETLQPQTFKKPFPPQDNNQIQESQESDEPKLEDPIQLQEPPKQTLNSNKNQLPEKTLQILYNIKSYKLNAQFNRNIAGALMILYIMGCLLAVVGRRYIIFIQFIMSAISNYFWLKSCLEGNTAIKKIDMQNKLKKSYTLASNSVKFDIMSILLLILASITSEYNTLNLIMHILLTPSFIYIKYQYFIKMPKSIKQQFYQSETKQSNTYSLRFYLTQILYWNNCQF